MSVYFPHTGYAHRHVEEAYKSVEKYTKCRRHIRIVAGDFNAELGPGIGVERLSVRLYTLNESNKRGDWMELWLMIQNFVALNTIYKKTVLDKKTTFRSPKAEAFDMEHMTSDHRCVMAHFLFPAQKNDSQIKHKKEKNNSKISIEAAAAATTKHMKGPKQQRLKEKSVTPSQPDCETTRRMELSRASWRQPQPPQQVKQKRSQDTNKKANVGRQQEEGKAAEASTESDHAFKDQQGRGSSCDALGNMKKDDKDLETKKAQKDKEK